MLTTTLRRAAPFPEIPELMTFLASREALDMSDPKIGWLFNVGIPVVQDHWRKHFADIDRQQQIAYRREFGLLADHRVSTTTNRRESPPPLDLKFAIAQLALDKFAPLPCHCHRRATRSWYRDHNSWSLYEPRVYRSHATRKGVH